MALHLRTQNSSQPLLLESQIKNETTTKYFYKVIQKQICYVHIFTHHVVVLPATTNSTIFHPQVPLQ
jgi:hypothetical protein